MAVVKDWIREAAQELSDYSDIPGGMAPEVYERDVENIAAIIRKHCPFKPDTAYAEVNPDATRIMLRTEIDIRPVEGEERKCGVLHDVRLPEVD